MQGLSPRSQDGLCPTHTAESLGDDQKRACFPGHSLAHLGLKHSTGTAPLEKDPEPDTETSRRGREIQRPRKAKIEAKIQKEAEKRQLGPREKKG